MLCEHCRCSAIDKLQNGRHWAWHGGYRYNDCMALDQSFVGKEYSEHVFEVGREKLKEFARAVKADINQFDTFMHPCFPVVYGSKLLEDVLYDPELKLNLGKLVHGEQEFVYYTPVKAGDTIKSTGKIRRIFTKGQHDFVDFQVQSFNQDGEHVTDSNAIFVIRGGNDTDFSLQEKLMMKLMSLMPSAAEKPEPAENPKTLEDGSYQVFVDKYMPQRYAGASGDFNAIHLDDKLGKSVGLGGYILHGMATMSMGANFAMQKQKPESIKKYKVRFSSVVKPFDTLTYSGGLSDDSKFFKFKAINHKAEAVLGSCVVEFAL